MHDPRATLNTYPETAAYLFTVDDASEVAGGDDARSAHWCYLDATPYPLYGSHAELINLAAEKLGAAPNIYHTLTLQTHEYDKTIVQAGHMAYEHSTITTERDALFVKAHDATRFDDPEREKHSRDYLVKEHQNYRNLEKQGFAHILARVGLVNDRVLGMDYLAAEDGWQWRAPTLFMAHNDARQSNIAWHPEHGIKIVDWSWADVAPHNADATMLLIDPAKSGYDVSAYDKYFNTDFATLLIGFWVAHSTWQTRDDSTTVREHQVASAATAFTLLSRLDQGKG